MMYSFSKVVYMETKIMRIIDIYTILPPSSYLNLSSLHPYMSMYYIYTYNIQYVQPARKGIYMYVSDLFINIPKNNKQNLLR